MKKKAFCEYSSPSAELLEISTEECFAQSPVDEVIITADGFGDEWN